MARSTQTTHDLREQLLARLAREDPELLEAASEVDRTLLRDSLARSPLERLRAATRYRRALARFRRVRPD
ncbi:MAG: hypothetical protein P1V51_15530 [Deltaproteobacteria bacterium]|nr:hypothetical protein [Deltaproteobacteria bacterium]